MANTRQKWATKEEAKSYALKAEKSKNIGLAYCAACDYLGWDVAARREAIAEREKSSSMPSSGTHIKRR